MRSRSHALPSQDGLAAKIRRNHKTKPINRKWAHQFCLLFIFTSLVVINRDAKHVRDSQNSEIKANEGVIGGIPSGDNMGSGNGTSLVVTATENLGNINRDTKTSGEEPISSVVSAQNDGIKIHNYSNSNTHTNKQEVQETKMEPQVCALFSVWGKNPRYVDEIRNTIRQLKALNPKIYTILGATHPSINYDDPSSAAKPTKNKGGGVADYVYRITGPVWTGWYVRTKLIGDLSHIVPQCDVTLSLDSHVTACSSNLHQRLVDFWRNARKGGKNSNNYDTKPDGPVLGTNVEHAPYSPWNTSGIDFVRREKQIGMTPHNFGIVWVKSKEVDELSKVWYDIMYRNRTIDDQRPLRLAMERTNFQYYTRIEESFMMSFKRFDKSRGFKFPRFTYQLKRGEVSLIHQYWKKNYFPGRQENGTGVDFCKYVNSDLRSRFVFLENENASYALITSLEECQKRLAPYDKRFCDDEGFLFGSSWES